MPYLQKVKPARQAPNRPGNGQPTAPISPQAAMNTVMALYSDARRQLEAIELFLSSFDDNVQYRNDIAYGAWLGAEWRIQLASLAGTLRAKIEKVYLPTLSAVVLHPECSPETKTALRRLEHRANGMLQALANLDLALARVPLSGASARTERSALRAAELSCRELICDFEDAMFILDQDKAAQWTEHCLIRPTTMVQNAPQHR